MKRAQIDIKKTIKKRIELRHQKLVFLEKGNKTMNDRDIRRKQGDPTKPIPIPVGLVSREERRGGGRVLKIYNSYEIKDYGIYVKPEFVDYDVLIYISSYNRYEKVLRILNALYNQPTDYSFKIIFMNDGSDDKRYETIKYRKKFTDITFLKNIKNGGKKFYWKTINKVFGELKKYETYCIIQIDDDFLLCDGFINKLMNKFFELKEENNSYMGIRYHLGTFNKEDEIDNNYYDRNISFQAFDGGSLFDVQFMKLIKYQINEEVIDTYKNLNPHVWKTLNDFVRSFGIMIYTMKESLAFHDDDGISKMHPQFNGVRKIYTKNFTNNGKIDQ